MKVKDLEDRDDLIFVSDSQEVQAFKESIGFGYAPDSLFVKIEDGECTEVYGMCGIIPFLNYEIWRIV